jgi:hypothetical protein
LGNSSCAIGAAAFNVFLNNHDVDARIYAEKIFGDENTWDRVVELSNRAGYKKRAIERIERYLATV